MSSALDLEGAAHTITVDTTETYLSVTDSVGSGTLTIEAGATLEFDDTSGAGFLSTSLAFTLTVTGTSTAWATIKSANSYPDNRWTLPPSATTVTATRCQWRDYTGSFATTWILNNPAYITDAYIYATTGELTNFTGTDKSDDVLMELLAQGTREINAYLRGSGITIDQAGDRDLLAICLRKSAALLLLRYAMDGTQLGAINVDGVDAAQDLTNTIQYLEKSAKDLMDIYISANRPSTHTQYYVHKVNG